MTTLFLSDLDGTLLDADQQLSTRTIDVVTRFVKNGGLFTYATARSLVTAQKVTRGLPLELPAIVYNGVFTVRGDPPESCTPVASPRPRSRAFARPSPGSGSCRSCTRSSRA